MPILLVGLGNPGTQYALTRHNAGFLWIDTLAARLRVTRWREQFSGLVSAVEVPDCGKLLLLKPQTFMNLSGKSVSACMAFFKLGPADLRVIHDDLDTPVGRFRLKLSGSHGGHNGVRDISRALGTDAYARLRLGIGRPADKEQVRDYVLTPFSEDEKGALARACDATIDALPALCGAPPSLS